MVFAGERKSKPSENTAFCEPGEIHSSEALADQLNEVIECLGVCGSLPAGSQMRSHIEELRRLKEHLRQGRFNLAVLGQFKRGKSTFLNALLGDDVLPSAVVPLTAIPTFVRAGRSLHAAIYFNDGKTKEFAADDSRQLRGFVTKFVTETNNPANVLGVNHVEVRHPAEILGRGVVLIDTPGIGSTHRHNTEATLNFLPQCDAAVFLISADPPVTEVEVQFLRQVKAKIPRLFFILNKVDYLSDDEKQSALAFFKNVLAEQVQINPETPVFCISARNALRAVVCGDKKLLKQSGIADVKTYLIDFLTNEKVTALQDAVRQKSSDTITDAIQTLQLSVKSLQMPLEDLEKRLAAFREQLRQIQQSKLSEQDLLAGDRKRMHELLEGLAEKLREKTRRYLEGILKETISRTDPGQLNEDLVEKTLADAIPVFFEHQTGQTTSLFQTKMKEVLNPHRQRAAQLVNSVRQTAAELFDIPYQPLESSEDFDLQRRPYWVTHKWFCTLRRIPPSIVDKLFSSGVQKQRILKRSMEQIEDLVIQNVENLRWAVYQNLDKSFVRFGSGLDEQLEQAITATEGAIEAALAKRKKHSHFISEDVNMLKSTLLKLTKLKNSF